MKESDSASRDYFGLAMGKRDDKYLSFSFGHRPMIYLEETLIIEPTVERSYLMRQESRHDGGLHKHTGGLPKHSVCANGTR